MTVLPLELIELIIQEVAESDPHKTGQLAPLLLVSKIFHLITRKYIFKPVLEITPHPLDGFSNPHRANLLFDILSGDPDLCDRVSRRVNIYMPYHDPWDSTVPKEWDLEECPIHANSPPEECPGNGDVNFRPLLNLLASGEGLSELEIYGISPINFEDQAFPSLKTLHLIQETPIHHDEYRTIARLLRKAPALETFALGIADPNEENEEGDHPPCPFNGLFGRVVGPALRELPRLRSVKLYDRSFGFNGYFLSGLAVLFEAMHPIQSPLEEVCIHLCLSPLENSGFDSVDPGDDLGWAA